MMKIRKFVVCSAIAALSNLFAAAPLKPKPKVPADLSKLVVVGDSLSAGVQNFSLLGAHQLNGYAAVIARQAGVTLTLPLILDPGAPNELQLESLGPPPVIAAKPGTLPLVPRERPDQQPTNLAVPGVTVQQALTLRPDPTTQDPVGLWANLVLGFPSPFLVPGTPKSQIEQAIDRQPTTVIVWLGNNDALVPALVGALAALTPAPAFNASYASVLDSLQSTGATLVTANIPDVTEVPYFTSAESIAAQYRVSMDTLRSMVGIGRGDFVRPSALPLIENILLRSAKGPLPQWCDVRPYALPVPAVPCVLTAVDAAILRSTVAVYNADIAVQAALHGALLVDINALVDRIHSKGYKLKKVKLTTDFLGGLFSLDGIHPTNAGYAVIANEFIDDMNKSLRTRIPEADVQAIAAEDPLVFKNNSD